MAIRTYIRIITLNVNRVNALTKRQRLAELREKERIVHMWSTRDQPQIQRHIQTESEGMEKGVPCKRRSKESWSINTDSDKIDFKNKDCYRGQRRTLHNDRAINPRGR